ncbi:TMEM150A isoform 11 [Pongo abelii]|uniref:TMEM150A isoform 11 n=1 Tax=Pongo abelii TaxID=9601 RepID=A0A2J8RP67_PONAB|nr:TMEM150A isoform 9 [Pongo abelii]PNJ10322.1 TMEM150A isoform 11 [Pongo abelii]
MYAPWRTGMKDSADNLALKLPSSLSPLGPEAATSQTATLSLTALL